MKRMSDIQIHARMEAYDEAIGHIDDMEWTEDAEERAQGKKLAEILRKQRDRWHRKITGGR